MSTQQLTAEQLEAVTFLPPASQRNLIIEAGAGAGKTSVLSERVKWLLTKAPVPMRLNPNQIFLVTFTNDAQKELKDRIQNVLAASSLNHYSSLIHISTIDGLFDSLVDSIFPLWWDKHANRSQQNIAFQIPPILTLVSESEVIRNLEKKVALFLNDMHHSTHDLALIIDFILSGGFKKNNSNFYSPTNTLENILKCMCQDHFLISNKEDIRIVAKKIHPATHSLIEKIHTIARTEYEKRILKGEFTYADKTVFLKENLQNNLPISIKELIVDEYQDTNFLQHEILCKLVKNSNGRMVVVGDPKQSIYGFRGATVNVFKSLLEDKEWRHILLNKNFRTHAPLLEEINILSKLAFQWTNPRHPLAYKDSFFYEEAQKKYIGENPLIPGIHAIENPVSSPSVYIVTTSIPDKSKAKLKLNELSPLAYASFLIELKEKEKFSWNEVVILCEKNKQIKILKEAFSKYGIPVKSLEAPDNTTKENMEDLVSLALSKCLAGKADKVDLYLIFMSPLVDIPLEEIYRFFIDSITQSQCNSAQFPHIHNFFNIVEEFKTLAKYNFFVAWQKLRWTLVQKINKNAQLFCAHMDSFAKSLFTELLNSNTRISLENSIFDSSLNNFILPDKLVDYSITKQTCLSLNEPDALEIKTIHKAKGLEWPYVCFYPKYGMQIQTGEFIASQSGKTLDISWLNQDVESLSVVERVENKYFLSNDSFTDENNKIFRYAEVKKQQEENYERQRVFYTAFTRPKKSLILFQPTLHHSSKKGLKELAIENSNGKKYIEYRDYLEQDIFTKYINLNFNIPPPTKNHELLPLKEVFYSEDNTIELTHYNLSAVMQTQAEIQTNSAEQYHKNLDTNQSWHDNLQFPSNDKIDIAEKNFNNLQNNTIHDLLTQKRNQRLKIHNGIVFHAALENKKINSGSIIYNLEKNSLLCKRELEVWSRYNNLSKRNIIDMLLVLNSHSLIEILSSRLNSNLLDTFHLQKQSKVALVIDFKTGQQKQEHVTQILNYMNLIQLLFAEQQKNEWHNIAVFGSIIYTNTTSNQNLSFNNELLAPLFNNSQEIFYLLPEYCENMPKNRQLLLTSFAKEVTI